MATDHNPLSGPPEAQTQGNPPRPPSGFASLARRISSWTSKGVLTGIILGVGRAAGETAPIMFTAATFYTLHLASSPFDEVMALPYHIYVLATAGTHIDETRPLQYGTVLVLITLVLGLNLVAIVIRARMRRKKRW